jgi:heptosyltransferase-3
MPPLASDAKVLIVTVARIGDTLLATPVMRAARAAAPRGQLTVLAHPNRLEVLRGLPFIDELRGITKNRAPWMGWLAGRVFTLAMVYGRDAALVQYAMRVAARTVAVESPGMPRNARLTLLRREEHTHAVRDRVRLAAAGGFGVQDLRLAYRVLPEEREWARQYLLARWPERARPLVALQTQSFPTKSHRDWPIAHFSELAGRILVAWPDARFLVLGDMAARASAAPLVHRLGERVAVAAGGTTLRESAALIEACDLYVGVDTGPTHIAGALAVPMVALYHPSYPGRNLMPLDHLSCRVIEHPSTGIAHRAIGLEHGMQEDMARISVDSVWMAAAELLGTRMGALRSTP